MHPLIPRLREARIIPVVRTSTAARAATAVAWLQEAGLRIFEITMTVPEAPALIRALAADPTLLVGAGTVADAAQAQACLDAGAQFIVAPWVDAGLAAPAQAAGACLMLGALTPTEVRSALSAGADVVKVFPAGSVGGPAHVRALRSVFPDVVFCPTGGVDARNVPDYIAAGAAFVGIGGRLVDEKLIAAGDRDAVQRAAEDALGIVRT
ncbi:bifunctional 4-hydroxy-2-oxoglutarate aldolase/2-dehydro-3-deoxy-phosphogluconate aldolase [Roseomonas terrae]|jgi:2-dehydro-3-deoxyphosphogluconate aldolase/(4S)-4-hydroxy-2-oxoglutarate aldolase|uniref:Bifunctional 4-hydroxy-2-oxoglutarate aldolase/2-dehydro-3-deoxy-phosphogluconate aldolase n=1 Tax=Neoroseomonas terrae TaxID=424799 RepID=A0ABS5EKK0_9PROT|nr:bifunctional 4-hydroxy-2-oxoglutarate aldolase/2-dehydro-3-deoxy-phosphogluconate aldolase [Neoroseomonas terrae]MBR0651550.1 bifunctional 4-hydroxy-2-oxoglutarate aldolase/2-dehydro-3-deoxy-phosphogluconate aldolase [Neoroseomonas terrae]